MSSCSRYHSQYVYHASAYGLAAEIDRPVKQSIHAQAATTLSTGGGRGTERVDKFCNPPFVSFDAAYSEVGGSFDDCHGKHTTYATATVEGLNIFDMVTADRVVARMVIYSPPMVDAKGNEIDDPDAEHSFSITGSYFDNLKIAGHKIDVKLATHTLHQHDTYSAFEKAYQSGSAADLLPWGNQSDKRLDDLAKAEGEYHALSGIGKRAKAWKSKKARRNGGAYWCSAAGHLNLADQVKDTELQGFGGIILIPKFGLVRLAELVIRPDHRGLTMVNVQMCSPGGGGGNVGGAAGSGGTTFP
jgi:hypothetical protein